MGCRAASNSLSTTFSVRTGQADSIKDTLHLRYTGIPVVSGIHALRYDTLSGAVTLAWKPVDYHNLLGYAVYRDPSGTQIPSSLPVNPSRIQDSLFRDAIFGGPDDSNQAAPRHVEYRVRAMDKDGNLGAIHEILDFTAPPPRLVRTQVELLLLGTRQGEATIDDTIRVASDYRNPSRSHERLIWKVDGKVQEERIISGREGGDTLTLIAGNIGRVDITLTAIDAAGDSWNGSTHFDVIPDPPIVDAFTDIYSFPGDTVVLKADARDGFGRIVKWEDLKFSAPLPSLEYKCILRVTDDDGMTATDTQHIIIESSRMRKKMPMDFSSAKAVSVGDRVFVFDDLRKDILEYDPIRDSWEVRSQRMAERSDFGVVAMDGKIYLIGGRTGNVRADTVVEEYDIANDSWRIRKSTNLPRVTDNVFAIDGKIHVIGSDDANRSAKAYSTMEVYDPTADSWSLLPIPIGGIAGRLFDINGRFVNYYWNNNGFSTVEIPRTLDRSVPMAPSPHTLATRSMLQLDGVIYSFGSDNSQSSWLTAFNTADLTSYYYSVRLLHNRRRSGVCAHNGRLFVFGGLYTVDLVEEHISFHDSYLFHRL